VCPDPAERVGPLNMDPAEAEDVARTVEAKARH
jgi:hypothetical protein